MENEQRSSGDDSDFEPHRQPPTSQTRDNVGEWIYKRESMQQGVFTPNVQSYEKVISKVCEVLTDFGEDTYRKFRRSCFGKYTKLKTVGRSVSAMHYVIAREVILPNGRGDKTELSFLIKGKRLRFTRFEFALITGLKFGGTTFEMYKKHPVDDGMLYSRVFEKKRTRVIDLNDAFCDKKIGDNPDDYVKVAKILFVYRVLIGCDIKKTFVSDWMWILVENSKEWDSFPWGSYSYQVLLHYLKRIKTIGSGKERDAYTLYGFSTAFLAWIYSVIPELAEANGGVTSSSNTPRIFWFNYQRSNTKVSEIIKEVNENLEPSDHEKKTKYWLSVEPEGADFKLAYDHKREKYLHYEVEHEDLIDQEQPERDDEGDVNMENTENVNQEEARAATRQPRATGRGRNNTVHSFTDAEREAFIDGVGMNVYNKIRTDRKLMKGIGIEAANCMKNDKNFVKELGLEAAKSIRNELVDFMPGYMEYMIHKENNGTGGSQQHRGTQGNAEIHQSRSAGGFDGGLTGGFTGGFQATNSDNYNTPVNTTRDEELWNDAAEQLMDQISNQADKNKTPIPHKLDYTIVRKRVRIPAAALCSPFGHYEARGNNYEAFKNARSKKQRNIGATNCVSRQYFVDIEDVSRELDDSQVEAYLTALYINPELGDITAYDPNITITSTSFMPTIHRIWSKYHNTDQPSQCDPETEEKISIEHLFELSRYVTGDEPKWGKQRTWLDNEKVIIVVRTSVNWVTCVLNLKQSYLMIYDSQQHMCDADDIEERRTFFIPLARIIPQVLNYSGFYDARPKVKPCLTQWDILYPDEPRLTLKSHGTHTAAYALKYVDSVLTGKFEPSFNQKRLASYRKHVAETIYKFSTDGETIAKKKKVKK